MSEWALETFKAYDIRGIAGSQLTPAFANRLGRALPTFLNCNALAVGRDIRESGPELHKVVSPRGMVDSARFELAIFAV